MHCAAERRPDVVESQPDAASQLNVAASANLAKEAGKERISWVGVLLKSCIFLYRDINTESTSGNVTPAISVSLICFP